MKSTTASQSIAATLKPVELEILRVCEECRKDENGTFCATWITEECARRGINLRPSSLVRLANLGFLERDDSTRGGDRRYYRIKDGELVRSVLGTAQKPLVSS